MLAAGDKYAAGSTGGSADAVVVQHYHGDIRWAKNGLNIKQSGTGTNTNGIAITENSALYGTYSIDTGYAGESGTGKNMPPYRAVYVWKKIT